MAEYAPSTGKRGICFRDCYETRIYPAVRIAEKWFLMESDGELFKPIRWDNFKFTEISTEAILEVLKEKWPTEDSILEMSDTFSGGMIYFGIYKIDYTTGKANGRPVHESGESFDDGIRNRRRDYWTPEEAAVGLCDLCNTKLDSIFKHIAEREAEIAKVKEQGELLKERFRNYKPKVTLTLRERVNEKLSMMTTESIAKAIGV